jgi:hypothetical protein
VTSPSFNYFYRVELTIANYALGDIKPGTSAVRDVVTKTYNFVNKRVRDAATSSERETYIPTLKSVGEVTLSAGEILPTSSFSAVSLDDSRGSFGRDRRFSDVLERSTIIGQPINLYIGEAPLETDAPPSWQLVGSGRVASWNKALSGESAEITIQIQPSKISEKVMNIEVSRDIPGMEDAPESSIGKIIPIAFSPGRAYISGHVFNGQQIIPTRISGDGATNAKYAVTTQMYRTTMATPLDYIHIKKDWSESVNQWVGFGVDFPTFIGVDLTTPISGTYTLNQFAASAYKIPAELDFGGTKNSTGYPIGSVQFSMKGQGSAGRVSNAYLSAFILRVDRLNYNVIEEIARGRAFLRNYDANNNVLNSNFTVRISFDRPVVLELNDDRECDFYIGFEVTGLGGTAGDMVINRYTTGAPYDRLVKNNTAAAGDSSTDWKVFPDTGGSIAYKLTPIQFSFNRHEDLFTPDGFTYSSLTTTQPAADIGQVNPALDALQVICLTSGFCAYADNGGTTAGTSSAYTLSVSPAWTQYVDGQAVECDFHITNNSAGATLSVDGLAALPIYENGSPIAANRFTNIYPPYPSGAFIVSSGETRFDFITTGVYNYGLKIYAPQKVLNILSYDWDGEQWEDNQDFDITTLDTSHYTPLFTAGSSNHRARLLSGQIEAKSTYSQVLSEVARGTASKIGIYSDGRLFVFPWGVTNPLAYIIPQEDIIPLSWETRSQESIVNRAQLSFVKNYLNADGEDDSFRFSVDFSSTTYPAVAAITERSRSIYGVKNILENSFPAYGFAVANNSMFEFPGAKIGIAGYLTGGLLAPPSFLRLISGGMSIDFLADYYISRFALPFVYCSFVVPYHRYKDIQMFDVISFHHSEFPAFFGTDPYARPGAVDDGTSVTLVPEANNGEEFVRAKSYRGLVEAVSYVMAMEHAPAIRLTVQVLINTEFDPT